MKQPKEIENGPGQWIFNNTLLQEKDFISDVGSIIKSFSENKEDFQSKMTLWEFLKQNLASAAKSFAACKSWRDRKH